MRILIHTDEYYPTAQACSYRMRTMADAFIDEKYSRQQIAIAFEKQLHELLN